MKRLLVVSVGLIALTVGIVIAWYSARQDGEFQRLIAAGDAALAQDETYGAIEAFSGALVLRSDSMLAYLKRGDAYRRRGELSAALRDLREAAALDPAAPRPVELLGDVNAAMGQHERAAELYRSFTQLDDQSPRVLYKLGLAYYRSGQPAEAIAPLESAVTLDPRFVEAHYLLAVCLRERPDDDGAGRSLARALELDAAFIPAREELADLHARAGRETEAIEQLEALAALEPARAERLIAVGMEYARWGRNETAILTLGRAAERFSDDVAVYTALGRVWLGAAEQRNDRVALGKAIEALQPRALAQGASSETLTLYGRALFLSGNAAAAERVLADATVQSPVDPMAFRYLADAAERAGHPAAARVALLRYAALVRSEDLDPAMTARIERLRRPAE